MTALNQACISDVVHEAQQSNEVTRAVNSSIRFQQQHAGVTIQRASNST